MDTTKRPEDNVYVVFALSGGIPIIACVMSYKDEAEAFCAKKTQESPDGLIYRYAKTCFERHLLS